MITLTADEARHIALWSQGFIEPIGGATPAAVQRMGAVKRQQQVHGMLRHLGAVQLDTISVLARSHELVAYARFGGIGRRTVEDSYWQGASNFEYWSHAACILPMESWPLFAFRRRHYQQRGIRWHEVPTAALRLVKDMIRADGPLTAKDLGGAKRGGEWWDWSESKIAVEWLLDIGEVVCVSRVGWRRVYDVAERSVPSALLDVDLTDSECHAALVRQAAASLGVGTIADIADVHRLKASETRARAVDVGLVPVQVQGWREQAWASPEALAWLDHRARATHRTTLLSPFDSLVWHRPRAERIFGMAHRLEAYTPAHKRVHGYFAMPVLHQGRLVARVDPKRIGDTLHASRVTLESESSAAIAGTVKALGEAATWVGADHVTLGEVQPAGARSALQSLLPPPR